ncbi:hypothetical protein ACFWZJ_22310 [Streptomyces massasporeus]
MTHSRRARRHRSSLDPDDLERNRPCRKHLGRLHEGDLGEREQRVGGDVGFALQQGRDGLTEQMAQRVGPLGRRGYDALLEREIAVKLIRPDVFGSPASAVEFACRFEREARVTARVGHHRVPQVSDAAGDALEPLSTAPQ